MWDVGTGNGQAAVGLAEAFSPVWASDASRGQLRQAAAHPRVRYLAATAEAAPFRSGSFRLITVAQAAHWFDLDRFFSEVARLLAPGGVVALWSYGNPVLDPAVDEIFRGFWSDTLATHWPPERRLVENAYRSIEFPAGLAEVPGPAPAMELREAWDLNRVLGYARTWSGTRRFMAAHGHAAVEPFERAMAGGWGDASRRRSVRWPLAIRAARQQERG